MAKLSQLREILLTNQINGYMHYDKKQLIVLLGVKGLLPPKPVKVKKEINSKYEKLATIRNNPKQVVLKNVETGGTITFPSIYKASKFIDRSPRIITFWNNRVWDNRYEIKIASPEQSITLLIYPRKFARIKRIFEFSYLVL